MKKLLLSGLILFALLGCKKNDVNFKPIENKTINDKLNSRVPITDSEKSLVLNLEKVTTVLKNIYKNKENLKIVNAAMFSKSYNDESVLLSDLIYPEKGIVKNNVKFKEICNKWNINIDFFANSFWKEVERLNDSSFKTFLSKTKISNPLSSSNNISKRSNSYNQEEIPVSLYFPYSDMFLPENYDTYYAPITSLITATADADEGVGYQPVYINGIFQYYVQVLVNDDYAYLNPTQIVGVNGIEPSMSVSGAPLSFPPTDSIDIPSLNQSVKQVYVGEVRIKGHQYDKLISFTGNGGGSEIQFTRADGFLKVSDGQVGLADTYFPPQKTISRKDIRESNWVDYSAEWVGNWDIQNHQINMAAYEEDNRNSSEFSGQVSTTLKLSDLITLTVGPIGFKITFKSDDALIFQTNLNRDIFFPLNRYDLEGEMRNNWPVRYRSSDFNFTLQDRTFY